jgi:hypothetical protein
MLYRSAAVMIVVFWVAMTVLLLRKELSPGATELREVPLGHVLKQMFLHGEPSDLTLYSERHAVGQLRLHPQIRTDDDARLLEYSGRLLLTLPGSPRQRISWAGTLEMNRALETQSAQLQVRMAEPANSGINLTYDPRANRLRYEEVSGTRTVERAEYPLDAQTADGWLRERGIDPALLQPGKAASGPPPTFRAWQSSMQIHGQKLETYRVALEQGGQTLFEFHVNQLGQVLQAKTFLGFTAAPEDVIP